MNQLVFIRIGSTKARYIILPIILDLSMIAADDQAVHCKFLTLI